MRSVRLRLTSVLASRSLSTILLAQLGHYQKPPLILLTPDPPHRPHHLTVTIHRSALSSHHAPPKSAAEHSTAGRVQRQTTTITSLQLLVSCEHSAACQSRLSVPSPRNTPQTDDGGEGAVFRVTSKPTRWHFSPYQFIHDHSMKPARCKPSARWDLEVQFMRSWVSSSITTCIADRG